MCSILLGEKKVLFPVPASKECTLDWNVHSSGPYTLLSDGSATWQVEIIFTHWQLWLSGLQSAKKRFTQMARERERDKETERERWGWIRQDDFSSRPFQTGVLKISSVGWCVSSDMLLAPRERKYTWWVRVWHVCVPVRGSDGPRKLQKLVGTRQGALYPLCLPGADFHPRWAGGRLNSLLVWHSLDDLGGMDGRHTAIHGAVTGNRKAVLLHRYFPANSLSLSPWQKETWDNLVDSKKIKQRFSPYPCA